MVDLDTGMFGRQTEAPTVTYALRRDNWQAMPSGMGDDMPGWHDNSDSLEQTLHRLSRLAGPLALVVTVASIMWLLVG